MRNLKGTHHTEATYLALLETHCLFIHIRRHLALLVPFPQFTNAPRVTSQTRERGRIKRKREAITDVANYIKSHRITPMTWSYVHGNVNSTNVQSWTESCDVHIKVIVENIDPQYITVATISGHLPTEP